MTFGEQLRQARKQAGLSQMELAGDRCSLSYVSHLEAGRRAPAPELVRYFEGRLSLTPGTLTAELDPTTTSAGHPSAAHATAMFQRAQEARREGSFGLALELATKARRLAETRAHRELMWQAMFLLVEVEIDLGRYAEANSHAAELISMPFASSNFELAARSRLLASVAARLADDKVAARAHADHAVRATAELAPTDSLRLRVLSNGVAANVGSPNPYEDELERLMPDIEGDHSAGMIAWVLGNAAFARAEIDSAIAWHERASTLLSPSASFRNWARFPRASADERLKAGTTKGVEELLKTAEFRLSLLDNPDVLATLALTQARYSLAKDDVDGALAGLQKALAWEDVPAATQAALWLMVSEVQGLLKNDAEKVSAALNAARQFTAAGMLDQAKEAWQLIDSAKLSLP